MKIVIDIDEAVYHRFVAGFADEDDAGLIETMFKQGIVLPKGHGRLIDADAIEYTHAIARCLEDGHNWNELCVTENELYDAPTIIDADKSESEDKLDGDPIDIDKAVEHYEVTLETLKGIDLEDNA